MASKRTDFSVGLFVIAGFIALLFLALKAGNLATFTPESATYEVRARFDNIGGLKARAPVRSAGVVVGRVAAIRFDNNTYQAVTILHIEKQYKFPKDSSAKILTSGLLGEQYVGIEPGGDNDSLVEGDRVENTQSALVLENLISQFLFSKAADSAPSPAAAAPAAAGAAPAAAAKPAAAAAPAPTPAAAPAATQPAATLPANATPTAPATKDNK